MKSLTLNIMNQEQRTWEVAFDNKFNYAHFCWNGDNVNGKKFAIQQKKKIKTFIRTLEDTIRKEERRKTIEEVIKALPEEKDDSDPYDHRQAEWNFCRELVLSTLNQMKENE